MSEELIWTIYWYGVAFILGATVGSFLNVVIARLPYDESVVKPRSRCPKCKNQIAWYDNIPLLSWMILRGQCRNCDQKISARYPGVELLTGILSLLLFARFVADPSAISVEGLMTFGVYFLFMCALVAASFIDLDHYIIPNEISVGGIPVGLILIAILDYFGFGFVSIESSALGVVLGGGSLWLIMEVYFLIRRREGMGMGDIKLLACIGAFLGAHPALLFVVFTSSMAGSVIGIAAMLIKGKDSKFALPFGPFLSAAAILYILYGYKVAPAFLGSFTGF